MNVIQEIENFIQKEIKDLKEQTDIDLIGNLYATENEILYTSLADNPLFAWLVYKEYSKDTTSDYNMSVLFRL